MTIGPIEVVASYDLMRDAFAINVLERGSILWDSVAVSTVPYDREAAAMTVWNREPSLTLPKQAATALVDALIRAGVKPTGSIDVNPILLAQKAHIEFAEAIAQMALRALTREPPTVSVDMAGAYGAPR